MAQEQAACSSVFGRARVHVRQGAHSGRGGRQRFAACGFAPVHQVALSFGCCIHSAVFLLAVTTCCTVLGRRLSSLVSLLLTLVHC